MKKHEIIAALTAKGVELSDSLTLAELRALAAQHGIDTGTPTGDPPPPAPEKPVIVFFRVGNKPLEAGGGFAAAGSLIRLKKPDADLHQAAGAGTIIGYA